MGKWRSERRTSKYSEQFADALLDRLLQPPNYISRITTGPV
jgi:hypothetical protein